MKLLSKSYEENRLKLVFSNEISRDSEFRVELQENKNITTIPFQIEGDRLIVLIPFRRDRSASVKILIFEKEKLQFQLRSQLYKYSVPPHKPFENEGEDRSTTNGSLEVSALNDNVVTKEQPDDNSAKMQVDIKFDTKEISSRAMKMIMGDTTYAVD